MSFNSAEARPAHRAACNLVPILGALLLAWLSTSVNAPDQRGAGESIVAASAATRSSQVGNASGAARGLRSVFTDSEGNQEARSYHPAFQTSDSTGELGIYMLVALCGLLLGAAMAPRAIQWLWRHAPTQWIGAPHQGQRSGRIGSA